MVRTLTMVKYANQRENKNKIMFTPSKTFAKMYYEKLTQGEKEIVKYLMKAKRVDSIEKIAYDLGLPMDLTYHRLGKIAKHFSLNSCCEIISEYLNSDKRVKDFRMLR